MPLQFSSHSLPSDKNKLISTNLELLALIESILISWYQTLLWIINIANSTSSVYSYDYWKGVILREVSRQVGLGVTPRAVSLRFLVETTEFLEDPRKIRRFSFHTFFSQNYPLFLLKIGSSADEEWRELDQLLFNNKQRDNFQVVNISLQINHTLISTLNSFHQSSRVSQLILVKSAYFHWVVKPA